MCYFQHRRRFPFVRPILIWENFVIFCFSIGNKKELDCRILEWDGEEVNVGAICIWYKVEYDPVKDSARKFNRKTKLKDIPVFTPGFHPCDTYV